MFRGHLGTQSKMCIKLKHYSGLDVAMWLHFSQKSGNGRGMCNFWISLLKSPSSSSRLLVKLQTRAAYQAWPSSRIEVVWAPDKRRSKLKPLLMRGPLIYAASPKDLATQTAMQSQHLRTSQKWSLRSLPRPIDWKSGFERGDIQVIHRHVEVWEVLS